MAQEDNTNTSRLNTGMLNSLMGGDIASGFSDSIDMEALKSSVDEINKLVQKKEDEDKQTMQEVLTTLQTATADKAVLSDSFNALENLSFKDLIGKPIKAAIEAQSEAARSTLEFVKELCVESKDGKQQVAVVSFEFFKNGKKARINLPLLSLVNIPSMEIKSMTYKFTAKIDSHSSLIVTHNIPSTKSSASISTPAATEEKTAKAKTEEGTDTTKGKTSEATAPERSDASETSNATETVKTAAASDTKKSVAKETTLAASYTSQTGMSATKDSKYAVSTTMDLNITIEPDEIPGGIKTMLSILDGAIEVINPNGELTVDSPNVVLQNGYAIVSASYRDPDGINAPGSIACKGTKEGSSTQIMLNSEGAKIIFTKPGLYMVTAGKLSEPVLVTETTSAKETEK